MVIRSTRAPWSLILSYEQAIRKKAYNLMITERLTFGVALATAYKDPVTKERHFITPLALYAKRSYPAPHWGDWDPKGKGKAKGKGKDKGKGKTDHKGAATTPEGEKICFRFNQGKCSWPKCKFLHVCSKCFKKGHNQLNCKAKQTEGTRGTPRAADLLASHCMGIQRSCGCCSVLRATSKGFTGLVASAYCQAARADTGHRMHRHPREAALRSDQVIGAPAVSHRDHGRQVFWISGFSPVFDLFPSLLGQQTGAQTVSLLRAATGSLSACFAKRWTGETRLQTSHSRLSRHKRSIQDMWLSSRTRRIWELCEGAHGRDKDPQACGNSTPSLSL